MMKTRRLKAIYHAQQGFTLIEIVVAIAISAVIGTAVASATFQVVRINALSINHQVAINQVQSAVHYISRDAQQGQQIIPMNGGGVALPLDTVPTGSKAITFNLVPASGGNWLTIQWIDWNDNSTHQVTYKLTNGALTKTVIINNGTPSTTPVANNISVASGIWHTDTRVLNFTTLTATIGTGATKASETRTFQINPRPAQ